ncbi:MAG TPA: hypothetical protein PLG43_00825 [Spirochaetia bacterium]|nr:hypothetical protein [Spirochaetia bacterium]
MAKHRRDFWLPALSRKITVFLFCAACSLLVLYIIGNVQEFMDSTLVRILSYFTLTASLYLITSVFSLFLHIVERLYEARRGVAFVTFVIFSDMVMILLLLGVEFILVWI